jgi:hypothetical protein
MFRNYIFYIFLFQFTTVVNSYTLLNRSNHTANYVDNKIYFLGGETEEKNYTNDFFYLDVSKPFTLNSDLPVVDLSSKPLIYSNVFPITTVCGSKNDTIFLIGGEFEDNTAPLVFAFNASNQVWNNVDSGSKPPARRRLAASTCNDESGKIYMFGGAIFDANNLPISRNDILIFDTNQFIWSIGSTLNAPPPITIATANILPDGIIVYLGGLASPGGVVGFSMV